MFSKLSLRVPCFIMAIRMLECACLAALPAAFVHYQGRLVDVQGYPSTEPQKIYLSLWHGGDSRLSTGEEIYHEVATVKPDAFGNFNYWLAEGGVVPWNLNSQGLKSDDRLFLQKAVGNETNYIGSRAELQPIANAWVVRDEDWIKYWRETGRAYKGPSPQPGATLEMRRGQAILYPDGRIQREDGTVFDTHGSTTGGVQELFDYCAEKFVDGYIVGGSHPGGNQVIYTINSPVHLHPAQGFRLDTGAINLVFTDKVGAEPGLTIDSCMMVDLRIRGQINYAGKNCAVVFHPTNLLPLDTFVGATIVDSSFHITTIATSVNCLRFEGSINFCDFSFNEINGGTNGVHVMSGSFSGNKFTCKHIHNQLGTAMLIEAGAKNVWEVNILGDAQSPVGVDTSAVQDIWFADVSVSGAAGLILRPAAQGNQFFLMGLHGEIKNFALKPTNRFYTTPGDCAGSFPVGFAVNTPPIPKSKTVIANHNLVPVDILILNGGSVTSWSLGDIYGTNQQINGALYAGQSIHLSPGETITLNYAEAAPSWKWRTSF